MKEIKNQKLLLSLMFFFAFFFWDTILIYPIKVFVVLLHEISHGLMAIFTGGRIIEIIVNSNAGGYCKFSGGNHFLIASAGYLGSIIWGGIILYIASRTDKDKILSRTISVFLLFIALFYVRNLFGFFFTVSFALILLFISFKASVELNDLILKFIGITSCLYVVIDIKSDLIDRTGIGSDADMIAKMVGFPSLSIIIGILWIIIALIVLVFILNISTQETTKQDNFDF